MSSYGSAHSGHMHSGFQSQTQAPQQQSRSRSYSSPPYPITPGSAPYPQQQQTSYFPPPPAAPYQQAAPTSNPIPIPASTRRRSSDHAAYPYGASPSYPPPSDPYSNSYPAQHLQPISQQPPIPENYQYSPQAQQSVIPSSPSSFSSYHHHRHRSSSSAHCYDPCQSYESAHSFQSAHSHRDHSKHSQNGYGSYGGRYNYGNENDNKEQVDVVKGYGDWDKNEVSKYQKNQDLERRPTLGGSLMSLVKKIGSSDRR